MTYIHINSPWCCQSCCVRNMTNIHINSHWWCQRMASVTWLTYTLTDVNNDKALTYVTWLTHRQLTLMMTGATAYVTWFTHALTHLDDDRSHGIEGEGEGNRTRVTVLARHKVPICLIVMNVSTVIHTTYLCGYKVLGFHEHCIDCIVCKILVQRLMLTFARLRLMELCVVFKARAILKFYM